LSMRELNAEALDNFIYTPVSTNMISYLGLAVRSVVQCDTNLMPLPPSGPTPQEKQDAMRQQTFLSFQI
ncbi:hypothetical protein F5883DRAFT_442406, partial [Diaporthe sp. PMI_573]